MPLILPEPSLVLLVGASGSGKSTFARAHFRPTEAVSSDICRALVADDENDQTATKDAFAVLHFIAARRLAAGRLTVVDATNTQPEARAPLVALAREHHCPPVAIVFNLPERVCHERNATRPERAFGPHVVRNQTRQLRRSLAGLRREGFHAVTVLDSPEEIAAVTIERRPLPPNRRHDHGPFDIIGDVHGCFAELIALLRSLGYTVETEDDGAVRRVLPPAGRRAVFLGDLCDRGPDSPAVLRLVMDMVAEGTALCVPGNHDAKLPRALRGRDVQRSHGLAATMEQLEAEPPEFRERVATFLDGLDSHYVLDEGRLVVAHAGMKAEMQGRLSRRVRDFALYGETTGETDEFGLPVRGDWASQYRGAALVVYGHTPVAVPHWHNDTINIDTGCVFGGRLTALRYPEKELVSVPAARVHYEPARPFLPDAEVEAPPAGGQRHDDLLDLADVTGKRIISTRLQPAITVREENAIAALEVMSRFAADPRWLIYLPPTMSPSETSERPGLLEHPAEALAYYRAQGVARVVCEEKHMGSRAVVVLGRDEAAIQRRFGIAGDGAGIVYTRTGRRFFDDPALEAAVLDRLRDAWEAAGFWERFQTGWACLDCELMPWSAKARELLRAQYAPVGVAARVGLGRAVETLARAEGQGVAVGPLLERQRERLALAERYIAAYGHYCWPVESPADLRLAPFHLLATEGAVHADRDHRWHMTTLRELCAAEAALDGQPPLLLPTAYHEVDLADPASEAAAVAWWEEITARGGEGMVVKPLDFIARGPKGVIQPAVKCRGREYLRVIYGPEYTLPENLARLRQRGLGAKRSLAGREFALGIEALERFVRREPLHRVHECVFAILALESEPVDPRL